MHCTHLGVREEVLVGCTNGEDSQQLGGGAALVLGDVQLACMGTEGGVREQGSRRWDARETAAGSGSAMHLPGGHPAAASLRQRAGQSRAALTGGEDGKARVLNVLHGVLGDGGQGHVVVHHGVGDLACSRGDWVGGGEVNTALRTGSGTRVAAGTRQAGSWEPQDKVPQGKAGLLARCCC
jgi:hypothetical protein